MTLAAHWHAHHSDPGPATWHGGTLPQWLTLAATAGAVGWAVFIYWRSVGDKRKEQPRLVYAIPSGKAEAVRVGEQKQVPAKNLVDRQLARVVVNEYGTDEVVADIDFGSMWIRVVNGSAETISNVSVSVIHGAGHEMEHSRLRVADFVAPGAEVSEHVAFAIPDAFFPSSLFPNVIFTDGVGHRWSHRAGGRLLADNSARLAWVRRPFELVRRRIVQRIRG